MGGNRLPMYAMVGEVTTNGTNLPTSFSWQCSFFTNQSKGLYNHKASTKAMVKRNFKKQCPTVENNIKQSQQFGMTSVAAIMSKYSTMTANLEAPITTQSVTSATVNMTETIEGYSTHDSLILPEKCHGTAPHLYRKHDDSHIHRALLIWGLPPEVQSTPTKPTATNHSMAITASRPSHLSEASQEITRPVMQQHGIECSLWISPLHRLKLEIKNPLAKEVRTTNGNLKSKPRTQKSMLTPTHQQIPPHLKQGQLTTVIHTCKPIDWEKHLNCLSINQNQNCWIPVMDPKQWWEQLTSGLNTRTG